MDGMEQSVYIINLFERRSCQVYDTLFSNFIDFLQRLSMNKDLKTKKLKLLKKKFVRYKIKLYIYIHIHKYTIKHYHMRSAVQVEDA